jgi:arylsulfatase A-like enzyme
MATTLARKSIGKNTRSGKEQIKRPVNLIDMHATLIELCGLPARPEIESRSLVPLIDKPNRSWYPTLMTHYPHNHAVRDDRYRYIRYSDGFEELYDHATDPDEFNNIAQDPNNAPIMAALKKYLPTKDVEWPDKKEHKFGAH